MRGGNAELQVMGVYTLSGSTHFFCFIRTARIEISHLGRSYQAGGVMRATSPYLLHF